MPGDPHYATQNKYNFYIGMGFTSSQVQNSNLAQTSLDGRLSTPNTLATWKENIRETRIYELQSSVSDYLKYKLNKA